MIAFNEMTQLARKANVHTILQQDNLSAWARNYWGTVFDTIATDETRYNARIEADRIMKEMNKDARYKR